MADVTLSSVTRSGDKVTLTGTGFTKTTTTVYVGEASVPFELVSDTEITIDPPEDPTEKISVEKGDVTTDEMLASEEGAEDTGEADTDRSGLSPKQKTPDHTPGDVDEEDTSADLHPDDLEDAANQGAAAKDAPGDEARRPSQLEPYPTGNPPPNRDYLGRYINDDGKPIDIDGNLIEETP